MDLFFFLTEFSRKVVVSESLYLVSCAETVAGYYSTACQEKSQAHMFCHLDLLWTILGKLCTKGRFWSQARTPVCYW